MTKERSNIFFGCAVTAMFGAILWLMAVAGGKVDSLYTQSIATSITLASHEMRISAMEGEHKTFATHSEVDNKILIHAGQDGQIIGGKLVEPKAMAPTIPH